MRSVLCGLAATVAAVGIGVGVAEAGPVYGFTNITNNGKSPSRIRHALLNPEVAPGAVGTFSNMKYISVMMTIGTTMIIAMLRWSAASWRRIRVVVAT